MRAGISDPTRPDAAKELGGLQIIDNRPRAVNLPRPDEIFEVNARLMHGRGLRVFHESEVTSGLVLERMRLHKVADAKQERLGEPAGQAIGQPRQAERVPGISDHVIERGPGVSDHAVVKPIPIETAGRTGTLHQEGVEFLGGTQLDDGVPHRLSDDIVIIAPGLRLKLTAENHVRHHRKRHFVANEIGHA